jgi:transposase
MNASFFNQLDPVQAGRQTGLISECMAYLTRYRLEYASQMAAHTHDVFVPHYCVDPADIELAL